MRKPVPILVSILVAAVAWIFFKNFRLAGLDSIRVEPRVASAPAAQASAPAQPAPVKSDEPAATAAASAPAEDPDRGPRIRVATFNAQALNPTKIRKPQVLDLLARIGRQFDVLALQEIESETDDILPRLVNLMNKTGQQYDYAIGPRVGPKEARQQYAFVFNRRTIVIDRSELYTVEDPQNLLTYEPFVGWFRANGPPASEAFTFSLVNFKIDQATALQERTYLVNLLSAVRTDGRDEDDVILAGDLQGAPGTLGDLDRVPDLVFAVRDVPTDVSGTTAWDNVAFQKDATGEFSGDSGVFDFLRKYNLSMEQAMEVSDHLPVYADFLIFEGGQPGRVATRPDAETVSPDRR
jgi:hypothetical protein